MLIIREIFMPKAATSLLQEETFALKQNHSIFVNEKGRSSVSLNKIISSTKEYTVCTGKGCTILFSFLEGGCGGNLFSFAKRKKVPPVQSSKEIRNAESPWAGFGALAPMNQNFFSETKRLCTNLQHMDLLFFMQNAEQWIAL